MEASRNRPTALVIVGTRPEVIKLAPVVRALEDEGSLNVSLALSGQHTAMVDQALAAFGLDLDFDLEASHDLDLMRPGQDLYHLAGGLLEGVRDVVRQVRPDMAVVQGDTATVFFGALVSYFERVPLAHVEAGLRSGDLRAPFPEEAFRRMTDVLADLHLAPTPTAAENLRKEGVDDRSIFITGNTVVDAVRAAAERQRDRGWKGPTDADPAGVAARGRRLVLLTAHRRESFGEPLRRIFGSVRKLADAHDDVEVLFPVHPNPNVTGPAREILDDHPRIHLTDPLDYLDLVGALSACRLVLTDSGGIQEEAPAFGAPVIVLREVTERTEAVSAGLAVVTGSDSRRILTESSRLLKSKESEVGRESEEKGEGIPIRPNPFGDGRAGERIADILVHALTGRPRAMRDWEGPGASP